MQLENDSRVDVYLFGSVLRGREYKDVDILIIYRGGLEQARGIRSHLENYFITIEEAFRRPLDVLFLSENEAEEVSFFSNGPTVLLSNFLCFLKKSPGW